MKRLFVIFAALTACEPEQGDIEDSFVQPVESERFNEEELTDLKREQNPQTPEERFELLKSHSETDQRKIYSDLREIVQTLSPDLLPNLFEWMRNASMEESKKLELGNNVLRRMARESPILGWEILEGVGSGDERASYLGTFLGTMSADKFLAELERAEDLPYPEDVRLFKTIARRKLKDLGSTDIHILLGQHTESSLSDTLAEAYGASVAREGAGLADLRELGAPLQDRASLAWAAELSTEQPQTLGSYIHEHGDELPQSLAMITMAVQGLAARSLPDARDWALSLPERGVRTVAVEGVTREWLRKDALAASSWAGQLPPGADRDAASTAIIRYLIDKRDVAGAEIWLNNISDNKARIRAAHFIPPREESSNSSP